MNNPDPHLSRESDRNHYDGAGAAAGHAEGEDSHDHHSHGGSGHTHHLPATFGKAFAVGITLNMVYVVAQVLFGLAAHSLALLADAGHNLGDVMGLFLAWGASTLAKRQPTPRFTYGLRRSTILASLANAILLLVAVGGITWEAIGALGKTSKSRG
jgi:cobalt-zinc-cadmium efflux system protein